MQKWPKSHWNEKWQEKGRLWDYVGQLLNTYLFFLKRTHILEFYFSILIVFNLVKSNNRTLCHTKKKNGKNIWRKHICDVENVVMLIVLSAKWFQVGTLIWVYYMRLYGVLYVNMGHTFETVIIPPHHTKTHLLTIMVCFRVQNMIISHFRDACNRYRT